MAKNPSPLKGLLAASFKTTPIQSFPREIIAVSSTSLSGDGLIIASEPEAPMTSLSEATDLEVPHEVPREVTEDETPILEIKAQDAAAEISPPKIPKPKSEGVRAPRAAKVPMPVEDPLPPLEFEGVRKTTVSFYAAEQAQVDRILDTLIRVRRHRGGFSDAIKIALRLCPIDPAAIAKAWDEARAADRRTTRK